MEQHADLTKVYEQTSSATKRNENGKLTKVDLKVECFKTDKGSWGTISEQLTELSVELLILAKEFKERGYEEDTDEV